MRKLLSEYEKEQVHEFVLKHGAEQLGLQEKHGVSKHIIFNVIIILYTCLFKLHGFDHMCQLERYMQITGRQGNWAGSNCLRIFVSDSCILSSEKHWAQYCVGTRPGEQRYHQHCLTHLEVHLAETRRYIPLGSEMAALSSVLSHPYHPRPSL